MGRDQGQRTIYRWVDCWQCPGACYILCDILWLAKYVKGRQQQQPSTCSVASLLNASKASKAVRVASGDVTMAGSGQSNASLRKVIHSHFTSLLHYFILDPTLSISRTGRPKSMLRIGIYAEGDALPWHNFLVDAARNVSSHVKSRRARPVRAAWSKDTSQGSRRTGRSN
jgi:hypothetical protein